MLEKIKEEYGDEMRLVFRHLPLITIHDKALLTAEAAEAAGAQGKFWEMHDLLFERQQEWNSLSEAEMLDQLVAYAEEIELEDVDQFRSELEDNTYTEALLADYEQTNRSANLNSTPTIFVNRVLFPAQAFGISYEGVDAFVKLMKLRENWYTEPEQVIDPDKEYTATIETGKGDIVIDLFADTAPVNVNSFVFLAQNDWYEGTTFHRVLPGFVAQGGDPTGTGVGFPGYRCGDEIDPSRTFAGPGIVSMANSGPDTNGSQFFITYDALPQLDANFTIIGQVIEGLEVAESLMSRDPQREANVPPGDKIIDIVIEEK